MHSIGIRVDMEVQRLLALPPQLAKPVLTRRDIVLALKSPRLRCEHTSHGTYWETIGYKILVTASGYYDVYAPDGTQIGWQELGLADCLSRCNRHFQASY